MSLAYELGDFEKNDEKGAIPFHLNRFRGISWLQAREIQLRKLETDQEITEVETIQSNAESVALDGFRALAEHQEAA